MGIVNLIKKFLEGNDFFLLPGLLRFLGFSLGSFYGALFLESLRAFGKLLICLEYCECIPGFLRGPSFLRGCPT